MPDRRSSGVLQTRIQQFSRTEKVFYGSIVLTALIVAVSIIFMQTRLLQVQHELTDVNAQINRKQTELDDAKQEVNELSRADRLSKLAESQELSRSNTQIKTVE
ncbi:cell division protein FtsL [Streptococcus himalayensis]|uniref:Cell division protein FtsL n=1 Tax=Streptococcus himalayensis TaxID=1888195 RepID=A0A917AA63_9STRE|nr:cell division protein FtsL [Streptococcus himalayensis]GGE36770.1 cell division protein FtsL [Streptococcus himalayensis]